jgi:D-lactate dehydrogenase
MRIAMFSTRPHDRTSFTEANESQGGQHTIKFVDARLDAGSAAQAAECEAACLFVHDQADAATLTALHHAGVRLVALRCTGFDHVDLAAAARLRLTVVRVPDYAPHAVAEHAVALMLAFTIPLTCAAFTASLSLLGVTISPLTKV